MRENWRKTKNGEILRDTRDSNIGLSGLQGDRGCADGPTVTHTGLGLVFMRSDVTRRLQ